MKTINTIATTLLLVSILFFSSCKKNEIAPQYSSKITNIISQDILDTLKSRGFMLNPGFTPPTAEGIFDANPLILQVPFGPEDGYQVGDVFSSTKYRLYEQQGDELKLDYKNTGTESGTGQGAFLSGSGNDFSLFIKTQGVSKGIAITNVAVISGTITPDGIRNFQYAFILTSKDGDEDNMQLIAVGKGRIFNDGDGIASRVSTF